MNAAQPNNLPALQIVSAETILQAAQATDALNTFIESLDKARKTANFIKWKLDIGRAETGLLPQVYRDQQSGATGIELPGIGDRFYNFAQAAKFIGTTAGLILQQAGEGKIYSVTIGNETYVSDKSILAAYPSRRKAA